MKQKTIRKEGSLSGIGLHSGEMATVFFKPAPVNFGIQFFSARGGSAFGGKNNRPVQGFADSARCTAIGNGEDRILTVEHLLAALSGLGITNIRVDVDGPEIPGLDGSALPFVKFFKNRGIATQRSSKDVYEIKEPIFCGVDGRAISILPDREFSVAYVLDVPGSCLQNQVVDFVMTPKNFAKQIAPARTFCMKQEAQSLKAQGLGKGANIDNTLVISEKGVMKNRLRFDDECARHKVLDIVVDMALLGFSVRGRVVAIRSGHALNRQLVQKIKNQREGI